jgi:hypothetical protein
MSGLIQTAGGYYRITPRMAMAGRRQRADTSCYLWNSPEPEFGAAMRSSTSPSAPV